MKNKEVVKSARLVLDEGLSLTGLLLLPVSSAGRESLLWKRGDETLRVPGGAGEADPESLLLPQRVFSLLQCSQRLEVRALHLSDSEEDEEEAVPLPEELEPSPGCGAILG